MALLHAQIPEIVRALHKQLKDKSVKTRQGCFGLLTALVTVLPGALDNHIGVVVPGILYSLKLVGYWQSFGSLVPTVTVLVLLNLTSARITFWSENEQNV